MSCPACFQGGVSASHPSGKEIKIHGLQTYVAEPENGVVPKGLIVFITDAFGWEFVNNRVLADHYAKKGGFLVYVPDFMDGNSMSPEVLTLMDKVMTPTTWFKAIAYKPVWAIQTLSHAIPWKRKTDPTITHPLVVSFLQALRTSPPPFPTTNLKIGAAGFCWGGKHTILLADDKSESRVTRHESQTKNKEVEPLLDAAFTAHPSYVELPGDVDAIRIPISIAIGDADMAMKAPLVHKMKEILDAKKDVESEVVIFPGAKHGFAIRTHPEDKDEMECAEMAEVQALEWFTKWLS